jgi:hypothetical protein
MSAIPQSGLCSPIEKEVFTASPPQKCVFMANPMLETNIRNASDMESILFTLIKDTIFNRACFTQL